MQLIYVLGGIPLGGIPLGGIPCGRNPVLGGIPLGGIQWAESRGRNPVWAEFRVYHSESSISPMPTLGRLSPRRMRRDARLHRQEGAVHTALYSHRPNNLLPPLESTQVARRPRAYYYHRGRSFPGRRGPILKEEETWAARGTCDRA
jgi:hypothetical protein